MSIKTYEECGETFHEVYVHVRSEINRTVRAQKRTRGIKSRKEAEKIEKQLYSELGQEVARKEGTGSTWGQIVEQWEMALRSEPELYGYSPNTIKDYAYSIHYWTKPWEKLPVSQLTRADGKEVLNNLKIESKSRSYQQRIKGIINVIYRWGFENKLIRGNPESPVEGVSLTIEKSEKPPEVLTLSDIRKLVDAARRENSPWYSIWYGALLTGMRSGELLALQWSDVDLENQRITVCHSLDTREKYIKTTKSGDWRTVPISKELESLLLLLRARKTSNFVFPRLSKWNQGNQAQELRMFCVGIGIKSIRFHALRACFATQLLNHGVPPIKVMKICGWKDLKTMQRYIRMAGIEEQGATDVFQIMPSDKEVMEKVVSIFEARKKREPE